MVLYTTETIEKLHENLRHHCSNFGKCRNPEICLKNRAGNLCPSCLGWLRVLEAHHRSNNKFQIKWRSNCETSEWPVDAWQVAKFFMSPLGDHKNSVTNAESTDLSSLLSVLERMTDKAFGANRRISVTLVWKLRSEVRNAWAHAPKQEATDDQRNEAFKVADEFLVSLNEVYPHNSVETVMKDIQFLSTSGLTNAVEAELKALIMWRKELSGDVGLMKEEIKDLREDQSSDEATIRDNEMKLRHLENHVEECVQQMLRFGREFESWRESLDNLYRDFQKMETFREETKRELSEMRGSIKKLQEIAENNDPKSTRESKLTSCIPEKISTFVGRENDVKEILSLLERNTPIVALVGGPGFGKSTTAVQIAHRLYDLHKIPVFFSSVRGTSSISEVIIRLCHAMGIHPQEDPKSSLIFWLRSVQEKAVLVIDNIEQLLEDKTQVEFLELLSLLRMHSGDRLQIVLTSRRAFDVSIPKVECVSLKELDEDSSIQLVRNCCPQIELQVDYLTELVNLCGRVPLALCIVASRLREGDDPEQLLTSLKQKPMKVLQTSLQKVENSIEMSFECLQEEEKTFFIRLSVFDGCFDRRAAQKVTELDGIETQNILSNLVNSSIVERRGGRYSLHLLIRNFLVVRTGFDSERKRAEEIMVEYFLKVCHSLTSKYWSRDGFCEARGLLQKDAHNVEKVFQLCQEALGPTMSNPRIVEILRQSLIYQSALRFFYHFIVHLLSHRVVSSFLESCAESARQNNDVAVEVIAMCLMTHVVGREHGWKSDEYIKNMELIKYTFDNRVLKGDSPIEARCNYYYNQCLSMSKSLLPNEELFKEAYYNLHKYLDIKKTEGCSCMSVLDKVDVPITLWQLGQLNQICDRRTNAAECFTEALSLVERSLGNHDFTLCCYKALGDLRLEQEKYEEALAFYDHAKKVHRNLGAANSNVSSVYLLMNCGLCLSHLCRYEEATCHLEEARDCVEKLSADYSRCKAKISQALKEIEYKRNKEV